MWWRKSIHPLNYIVVEVQGCMEVKYSSKVQYLKLVDLLHYSRNVILDLHTTYINQVYLDLEFGFTRFVNQSTETCEVWHNGNATSFNRYVEVR